MNFDTSLDIIILLILSFVIYRIAVVSSKMGRMGKIGQKPEIVTWRNIALAGPQIFLYMFLIAVLVVLLVLNPDKIDSFSLSRFGSLYFEIICFWGYIFGSTITTIVIAIIIKLINQQIDDINRGKDHEKAM